MPLVIGDRLGSFEIVGALGAGGMGEVYRAHDTTLGRDVAIKILPQSFLASPDRLARFEPEAACWPPSTILTLLQFSA
jgi:eukaryotic-like serine/threonine-protein kinase